VVPVKVVETTQVAEPVPVAHLISPDTVRSFPTVKGVLISFVCRLNLISKNQLLAFRRCNAPESASAEADLVEHVPKVRERERLEYRTLGNFGVCESISRHASSFCTTKEETRVLRHSQRPPSPRCIEATAGVPECMIATRGRRSIHLGQSLGSERVQSLRYSRVRSSLLLDFQVRLLVPPW
jgi:hypothetical protein